MKCWKCGTENSQYVSFCESCGSILGEAPPLPNPKETGLLAGKKTNPYAAQVQAAEKAAIPPGKAKARDSEVESSYATINEIHEIQISHHDVGHGIRRSMEWDEYYFECLTNGGKDKQQQQLLAAPSVCGFSLLDMTVIPEKGSRKIRNQIMTWKAKITGSNYDKLNKVSKYLVTNGWTLRKDSGEAGSNSL